MATLRGDAGTPAWHLARLRESTDDILGFGMNEFRFGIVDGNGTRGSLGKRELDSHSVYHSRAARACQAETFPIVDNLWVSNLSTSIVNLTIAARLIVIIGL